MKKLSFRIRKRYFDDIVAGKKTVEYRGDIPFWRIRVANIISGCLLDDPNFTYLIHLVLSKDEVFEPRKVDADGVFICGKRIHRRKVTAISRIRTPDNFSEQGKKDVDTEFCFAFYLGDAIHE